MLLATNVTDFKSGALGLVELAASYLNDRKLKYWSKAELITYATLAQFKIASAINSFYEAYFLKVDTVLTVTDQSLYSFPTDALQIFGLEIADNTADLEPRELTEVHFSDRNFYNTLSSVNAKLDMEFFFIQGTQFALRPRDGGAGGREIRIFNVERLTEFKTDGTDDTKVSKIPAEHHELLALGMAIRARAKINRPNRELHKLYAEGIALLERTIRQYSPQREWRRKPFWGTYGPDPPITTRNN